MGFEVFENISELSKHIWALIVSGCAIFISFTVLVLNLYKIKKIRLEIDKLEREKSYETANAAAPINEMVGEVKKYTRSKGLPTIEWPK